MIPFTQVALFKIAIYKVAVGLIGRRQILFERNHRPVSHGHNLARTLFDLAADPSGGCREDGDLNHGFAVDEHERALPTGFGEEICSQVDDVVEADQ